MWENTFFPVTFYKVWKQIQVLLWQQKNISLDPRANFFSKPLIRDANNLNVSQIKQSSQFSIHAGERYQMSGLALAKTPFPNLVHILNNLNRNWPFWSCTWDGVDVILSNYTMALLWGANVYPVSRQTSQQPMEEVIVFKHQPRGAIRYETNPLSWVTSEWPIPGVRHIMAHTGQRPESVGNSLVQVYERGGKSVNSGCKSLKSWLTHAYWAVKRTRKLPWLRQCNRRLVYKRVRGRTTGQGLPVRVIILLSLPPGEGNMPTN